jgi:c-di-GMP-binding flagellar brake protein YcgR
MTEGPYKTGDYVELKLLSGQKGDGSVESNMISESIITRTGSDNVIWISMPTHQGQVNPLEDNEVYEIRFIASAGSFACRARVVDDSTAESGNEFELKLISELMRDCKRMFYRLDKIIPVMYSLREDEGSGHMLGGTCFNLSGGGVRFSSGTDIERGRFILMNLMLGGDKNGISVPGRVIYTDNVEPEEAVYEHRVEFTDISPDVREKIIRYCFDEASK